MKVVILCGGKGQRISTETRDKPKPLIKIGKLSILEHIVMVYKNNVKQFFFLQVTKEKIKQYFKKLKNIM